MTLAALIAYSTLVVACFFAAVASDRSVICVVRHYCIVNFAYTPIVTGRVPFLEIEFSFM